MLQKVKLIVKLAGEEEVATNPRVYQFQFHSHNAFAIPPYSWDFCGMNMPAKIRVVRSGVGLLFIAFSIDLFIDWTSS